MITDKTRTRRGAKWNCDSKITIETFRDILVLDTYPIVMGPRMDLVRDGNTTPVKNCLCLDPLIVVWTLSTNHQIPYLPKQQESLYSTEDIIFDCPPNLG